MYTIKNICRVLFIASFLFSTSLFAQLPVKIKPPKIENVLKNDDVKKAVKDNVLKERQKKMEEKRKDFEDVDFNYAISFTDNAGLFETKEKGDNLKGFLNQGLDAGLNRMDGTKEKNNIPAVDIEDNAQNFNATGEMFFAGGKYRAAELAFRQSLRAYGLINKSETSEGILPLSNLALLYHTTGRYTKADSLTQVALKIREANFKGSSGHGVSVNNKAVLYKDMGRYNESEKLIEEALALTAENPGPKTIAYAIILNNKAMLYQAVGRNEEAEKLIKECLAIAKTHLKENSSNYVKLSINLALLYQGMNRYDEAEKVYLDAIKMKEKKLGKNHPDYAHLKSGLAALYLEMGRYESVEALLKEAADIYKKKLGEQHPSYASSISDLGNYYRINSRVDEAETLLSKALEIRKNQLGEMHPDYINSLEDYTLLQWQKNNIPAAVENYKKIIAATLGYIDAYFAPMSESEKGKFWAKMTPRMHRFNSFCVEAAPSHPELIALMYNNQLRTKALLLNSSSKVRQQIMNSGNDKIVKKYTEWLDQKENLARLYTLSKDELAQEKINLDSLERVTNNLEKELSSESEIFSAGFKEKQISFQELVKVLKPDEAIVEIVQFRHFNKTATDSVYYAAMVLDNTTNTTPQYVVLKNGSELETTHIQAYRKNIKRLKDDPQTYVYFWSEINKLIAGKKNIYVSPDGVYNQVSINTILEPSGKYIIDTKNILLVGNSKDVLTVKAASGKKTNIKKTASLYGYPKYGDEGKISELPGTKKEVENIDKILKSSGYKTNTYFGLDANEQNVKATTAEILHIATHGFFLPAVKNPDADKVLGIETSKAKENPLHRSGIMLAGAEGVFTGKGDHNTSNNGVLTAYEAMNMFLDNTELVVLSACETGLGDVKTGEGVYGLQRSFLIAGAKAVIMSLWTVSDDATVDLMTNFYKNYAISGNKQDAFIKAQKQLKLKYPQPNYWGAFVLMGN